MDTRYFSEKVVKWYRANQRPLPWRETTDPYKIWLSEVILQQTRVAQGLPYYERFVAAFPTVHSLARASEEQVLRLWQGLGYYTRARNLHKCAKVVVEQYGGKYPNSREELLKLPGIGPYTAAAIASIAFGEPAAVVDGNVFRVLARIFGIETPINTPEGKKQFSELADTLISDRQPAAHNQAVMEFGATFCTPHNPVCEDCPFKLSCHAYTHDLVDSLPVKIRPGKIRSRYFYYIVVERNNRIMMRKRDGKDIWHGLYDFLLIEKARPVSVDKLLGEPEQALWLKHARQVAVSPKYVHILSHQKIHCRFVRVGATSRFKVPSKAFEFYSIGEIDELPKPVLITRFLTGQRDLSSQKIGTFESL